MKKKFFVKTVLATAVFLCSVAFTGMKAEAAEQKFIPTLDMETAPVLGINNEGYWAETAGECYASFITPQEGGYLEIECKNISIPYSTSCIVYNATQEVLANYYAYEGGTLLHDFRSEPGRRNNSLLEPNTKYYIKVGNSKYSGNVKLVIRFRADANPDGKEQAETISLNREYTRSSDGYTWDKKGYRDPDHDYFKFTANSSGAHHFKITNTSGDRLYYDIRKLNSEELVKTVNGRDMQSNTWNDDTSEFDILLEKGQMYYLTVHNGNGSVGNYTFSFNDQRVQQIVMPVAELNLAHYETYTIHPTVLPAGAYNKTLTYSTSDRSVVWVNSSTGQISASKPGKAVITATATDGSKTSASCVVYVSPLKPYGPWHEKSSADTVKVSWENAYGATGYTLYYKVSSAKSWKVYKNTTSTSCSVKKLRAGTKYQFKVRAYTEADGKRYSVDSDILKAATSPKKTSITKVSRLSKEKNYSGTYYRAKVKWKKVSGASSYKLYYKAPGSSYKTFYKEVKKTSATVRIYRSRYIRGSKKYTFYVVPTIKYNGRTYEGACSKGKKYTLK